MKHCFVALRLCCDATCVLLIFIVWTLLCLIVLSFSFLDRSLYSWRYWVHFERASAVGNLVCFSLRMQFKSIQWICFLSFVCHLFDGLGLRQSVLKSSAHFRFCCPRWPRCYSSVDFPVHRFSKRWYCFVTTFRRFLLNWSVIPRLWLLTTAIGILRCSLGNRLCLTMVLSRLFLFICCHRLVSLCWVFLLFCPFTVLFIRMLARSYVLSFLVRIFRFWWHVLLIELLLHRCLDDLGLWVLEGLHTCCSLDRSWLNTHCIWLCIRISCILLASPLNTRHSLFLQRGQSFLHSVIRRGIIRDYWLLRSPIQHFHRFWGLGRLM